MSFEAMREPAELYPAYVVGRFEFQFAMFEAERAEKLLLRCALGGRFESYPPFADVRPKLDVRAEE
jgi:hypothetical protein